MEDSNADRAREDTPANALGDSAHDDTGPIQQSTIRDLIAVVLLCLGFQLLLSGAFKFYAFASDIKAGETQASQQFAWLTPLSLIFTFGVTCHFGWRKYGNTFGGAFNIRRISPIQLAKYFAIALLLVFFALSVIAVAAVLVPQSLTGTSKVARVLKSQDIAWVWMVSAVFAPIVEELFYRGFAFGVLQRSFNTRAAVLLIIAWFTMAHIDQLAGDWPGLVAILVVSVVLTQLRARTNSLTPCIVVHLVYNIMLVTISTAASYVSHNVFPGPGEPEMAALLQLFSF